MSKARLLLIEDNPRIQLANKDMLELLDYEVSVAMNLDEARACIAVQPPDVIVLDIMLPDGSGLDFLQELRRDSGLPVLLLTALSTTEDTVRGLTLGADDYLAKPYAYPVLAARVDALLRRAGRVPETLVKNRLTLNILSGQAFVEERDILLTGKEFSVLLQLAQHEDTSLAAGVLYERVWRQPLAGDSQALRSVIARLRAKLAGSGYVITARRKGGYVFQSEEKI